MTQTQGRGRENVLPMADVKLRSFNSNMHIQPGSIKFVCYFIQIGSSMRNITYLKPRSTSACSVTAEHRIQLSGDVYDSGRPSLTTRYGPDVPLTSWVQSFKARITYTLTVSLTEELDETSCSTLLAPRPIHSCSQTQFHPWRASSAPSRRSENESVPLKGTETKQNLCRI